MREERTLLVGLLAVCIVSSAALVRLIAVVRIFRRQRREQQRRSTSNSSYNTNGDPLSHQQQQHLHQDEDAMPTPTDDDRVASSRVLVPSLLFHVLVFLCLVVEVPVYACRWLSASGIVEHFSEQGRQLYSLHMTSFLLLFMAFSVVVTLWSDVAVFEPNEWTALVNRSMVVLCLCYVLVTSIAVGACLGLGSVKHFLSSYAFLLFCAYSVTALLFLGTCFLVLGCLMQRRICRVLVTDSCTARLTARVVRLNVAMLACFVCFTMRALMLAALVRAQAEGEETGNFAKGWKRWERDMRLEWALHLVPCVAMLYLMRKAGEPTSSSSSSTRALASAAEREEAGYDARNVTGDEKRGLAGGGGGAGGSGSGEGTDTAAVVGRDYGSGGGR
ncbi:unnamed protein product [Pylaiella littoralis]